MIRHKNESVFTVHLNFVKMKAIYFMLFLQLGVFAQRKCPKTILDTYSQLTDNLWGVQTLRKNLYASLATSRSSSNKETYNAITSIMDSLRRRNLDLYPVLSGVARLRDQEPQQQLMSILQLLHYQEPINCAAAPILEALRRRKIHTTIDLTESLDKVRTFQSHKPLGFVFQLIHERINSCIPSQQLIGAILINVPVRTSVSQARDEICSSLQYAKLPKHIWDATLQNLPTGLETPTRWLAKVVRTIGTFTNHNEKVSQLADGILQLDDEPATQSLERTRRSAGDELAQNVRTLSRAIAEYTLSIIRRHQVVQNRPKTAARPPRQNFFLNPQAMITQIQEKISQQASQALSSSEESSRETHIAMAILRRNAANNTEVDENINSGEGE